jgi:FkbH-like protein
MFQFDWGVFERWSREPGELRPSNFTEADLVRGAMVVQWKEHCLECAPPQCYSNCMLFVRRGDNHCARLFYGIYRNPKVRGLFGCGADLRFRRWGKIEARLTGRTLSVPALRLAERADRFVTWMIHKLEPLLHGIDSKRRCVQALSWNRDKLLMGLGRRGVEYDEFLVECYGFEAAPSRLIVELRKDLVSIFRAGLDVCNGYNRFSLDIPLPPAFGLDDNYLLMVYPQDNQEIRLVFTCLDFVVRNKQMSARNAAPAGAEAGKELPRPAEKVKCVGWDLDNTLWQGILIEDGEDRLRIRPEAVSLIHWFDERGIVQTIVSKNHHDQAMAVLARNGLEEFFLYPAINWGPKSENLRQVANSLNINLDTMALIDDSAFERREVKTALPMVRVYAQDGLEEMRGFAEFDVPVTEASRLRRKSYLTEMKREQAKEIFGSEYMEFLRSCQLRMRLFSPHSEEEIARCHELIQRSNQLNLSARRYDRAQLEALLADRAVFNVAMECEDRFGSYGIVGFASIEIGAETPVARDFVLSCRVAQKRVEHAFYAWLGQTLKRRGADKLLVQLIKTSRNSPLRKVFEEMPFTVVKSEGEQLLLAMDLRGDTICDDIVTIDDGALGERGRSDENHRQL